MKARLRQTSYSYGYSVRNVSAALPWIQFVIFKPLSYCFEETIEFDVKGSFVSRPESRLIR